MDGLISRQAAIDCEYQVKIINDIEYVMLSEVQMKMRKLPSAQQEIIRCKDCDNYQTDWIPESVPDRRYCATMDSMMPKDGYCSYAERRTDEHNTERD